MNENVLNILKRSGVEYEICEYDDDFEGTQQASEVMGVPLSRLTKTLVFRLPIGIAVIMLAGDRMIDPKKYKAKFKVELYRLDEEDLKDYTGYVPGAVSPIGLTYSKAKVYMDRSLEPYLEEAVYPSGGTLNSAVGIKAADLYKLAGCREWIDVAAQPKED